MAKASFKKRDKNRYRKLYPYIRKKPVWDYCSDVAVEIEVGEIVLQILIQDLIRLSLPLKQFPT